MEALGRTAIVLFCYVFTGYTEQVLACQQAPSTFKNIWYIDPVNGKTPMAGGTGSQAHPWNSLEAIANYRLGTPTRCSRPRPTLTQKFLVRILGLTSSLPAQTGVRSRRVMKSCL
jgi:hypothetical protein